MEKTIEIKGLKYKAVPETCKGSCSGCSLYSEEDGCVANYSRDVTDLCYGESVIFIRVYPVLEELKNNPVSVPSISLSFDLDLSTVSLPEVFKVKSLRLSTLDDALVKGTDAFTISAKDVPQETIEVIAQALAMEFLRRHLKV
jgi:hypothetical protein